MRKDQLGLSNQYSNGLDSTEEFPYHQMSAGQEPNPVQTIASRFLHFSDVSAIEDLPPVARDQSFASTISSGAVSTCSVPQDKSFKTWIYSVLGLIGPGWIVAMAYLDPGNLAGDISVGTIRTNKDKNAGYELLWVLLGATLIGYILQRMSIHLGVVTRTDLGTLCRLQFSKEVSICIWAISQLCLIGADMQAVIGSAIAFNLLFAIPIEIGIVITLIDVIIISSVTFLGIRKLEASFAFLISLMAVSFLINMFTSHPSFVQICSGIFLIRVPERSLPLAMALIGSVIMPHNFFLQSAVVQNRPAQKLSKFQMRTICKIYDLETFVLLMLGFIVNLSVVVAFANPKITFSSQEPQKAVYAWGIGLLAAGQCSTIACTYAGQIMIKGLLDIEVERSWVNVLAVRILSIIPLFVMTFLSNSRLDTIATYINVMQAFNLPVVLILLYKFNIAPNIMGTEILSRLSKTLVLAGAAFLLLVNLFCLINILEDQGFFILTIGVIFYFGLLVILWEKPLSGQYSS